MNALYILIAIVVVIGLLRRVRKLRAKAGATKRSTFNTKNFKPWQKQLYTVFIFFRLNTRRFFRDRLALFFGILFPLIFLFVFGGIFGQKTSNISFKVALLNQSNSSFSKTFAHEIETNKVFNIDNSVKTFSAADEKMGRNQLDATIILPPDFGRVQNGVPGGQINVDYTENNATAGTTLISVLQSVLKDVNSQFVKNAQPFSVAGKQLNQKSLTQFDYTFAGLLGFSIIGLGIFGPINVFPELKKQGILRRLHTTPLRVWQYFISTMISQAIIGLISLAIMFIAAISVFHLKVIGNWLDIVVFLIIGIVMILGVGLAIGGWAKNERQAAPLGNIIVFPMMFLTGVFFPRFLIPEWLQGITNYLPLTPVIDGIRLITTEGKSLLQIGTQLEIIGVWLVVIYIIAFKVFRWE